MTNFYPGVTISDSTPNSSRMNHDYMYQSSQNHYGKEEQHSFSHSTGSPMKGDFMPDQNSRL